MIPMIDGVGEPAAQPLLETGDHDLKDPAKMTEESAGWQKTLFEVFRARLMSSFLLGNYV